MQFMLVLGLLRDVYFEITLHNLPWTLMGDFNEVLYEDEKLGGNTISQRRVRAIQDCMNTCQMMDLGFSRLRFT